MRPIHLYMATAVAITLSACGNNSEVQQQKVESLQEVLQQRETDYTRLNEFVTVVSDCLDSIHAQEEGIFRYDKESPTPDRRRLRQALHELQETLKHQRSRIAKLKNDLASGEGETGRLQTIIAAFEQQLEQKNSQIAELITQLEQSNMSVEQLTRRVGKLSQHASEQATQIAQQEEVLQAQDKAINEGFVRMGTKKELKDDGLLTGGFLKKTRIDYSNVKLEHFQKIDIREVTRITIPSKSPKILTNVPAGTYTLERDGQNTLLLISDPQRFWSVSNFLIIQTR